MLKEGDKAPDFELADSEGKAHKLSDYVGKKIVLYFYPRDNTPGCTKEACSFRDNYNLLQNSGLVIIGISTDSEESHKRFQQKYKLPFILLADKEKEVVKKYRVWQEKNFMGRKFMGTVRTTFIIDQKGNISKIFSRVKPDKHAEEVLASP